ncbi:uncharacterized protein G2W53_007367 [Senna tora]|uniref:Uncharacterized protein n=1 Tax=Senna tora TaxID=362788 RepID=A0A834X6K6_9FABA|nr:uncharacterized protein G2W53_007367 [Senna tora]
MGKADPRLKPVWTLISTHQSSKNTSLFNPNPNVSAS